MNTPSPPARFRSSPSGSPPALIKGWPALHHWDQAGLGTHCSLARSHVEQPRESAAFLAKWNLMWFRSRRQRGKDSFFGQTFPSFGYFVWEILGSKAGWLMELSIDLNHQVPPCPVLSDSVRLLKPGWCHPKAGASNSPSSSKPT